MREDAQKGRCLVPSRLSHKWSLILAGLLIAIPSESIARPHPGKAHGGGWRNGWQGGGPGYQRGYVKGYGGRYAYGRSVYYGYPGYGGYRPYGGYVGYPGYYGYGGYYGHGHHHHNNGAWIAVGAGLLGVVLGSVIAHRHVYPYGYVNQAPPPPPPPATQQCPDGSTVPAGNYCPEPAPAPAPAPPPPVLPPPRG